MKWILLLSLLSKFNEAIGTTPSNGRRYFYEGAMIREDDKKSVVLFERMMADLIKDTDERFERIERIRLDNFRSASYEIGFLNYLIIEEYRKMLAKYNVTLFMGDKLYPMEVVLYLVDIEAHFWQIGHLINMQHEVERKYRVISDLHGKPEDILPSPDTDKDPRARGTRTRRRDYEEKKLDRFKILSEGTTKKKSTRWWWPIDYGWEIEKIW